MTIEMNMKKYYYTIGEVSQLLAIKQHVIRYWETEFPQLNPRKEHGRNRRYSLENVETLKKIKDMLYEQRYTIEGARQRLAQQNKSKHDQLEFDFQEPTGTPKNQLLITMQELRRYTLKIQSEFNDLWESLRPTSAADSIPDSDNEPVVEKE